MQFCLHQIISYDWQVQGTNVAGLSAPVTTLNFCWLTLSLAVGNECGVVRTFSLHFLFLFDVSKAGIKLVLYICF